DYGSSRGGHRVGGGIRGGYGEQYSQRHPQGEGHSIALAGSSRHWHDFTGQATRLLCCEPQCFNRAADLAIAVSGGKAGLALHDLQHVITSRLQQSGSTIQDAAPLMGGKIVLLESCLRDIDHATDLQSGTCRQFCEWLEAVLVENGLCLAFSKP